MVQKIWGKIEVFENLKFIFNQIRNDGILDLMIEVFDEIMRNQIEFVEQQIMREGRSISKEINFQKFYQNLYIFKKNFSLIVQIVWKEIWKSKIEQKRGSQFAQELKRFQMQQAQRKFERRQQGKAKIHGSMKRIFRMFKKQQKEYIDKLKQQKISKGKRKEKQPSQKK